MTGGVDRSDLFRRRHGPEQEAGRTFTKTGRSRNTGSGSASRPKRTAREIRARFRDIDHRLAEVENYYVSNNARLSAEIERLR